MARSWRKWRTVLAMFFQDGMVYKANAVIWILTDVVTAVTMPLIWLASYNGRGAIHGFAPSEMVTYYLVMLALTSFIESHILWDMASDVKQGKFNIYLIRPYSFLSYMYAANLGWRVMRTLLSIPLFALVFLAFRRYLPDAPGHYHWGAAFWLAVALGHGVSFAITYALGLLSLWFYEVRSLYNFYYLPLLIFSGQLAPLALFPVGLQHVVRWLPFPYTLAFPVQVFLGKVNSAGSAVRPRRPVRLDRAGPGSGGGIVARRHPAVHGVRHLTIISNHHKGEVVTLTPLSLASAPVPVAGRPVLAAVREVFVNPVIAALLTLALLGFCTRELLVLQDATHQPRPYTILYLIPVAIGAALLGTRGGVLTAALAVALARIYLFNDAKHGLALLSTLPMSESIEMASLAAGTLSIAVVTGSLRSTLSRLAAANQQLREANAQLVESEQQRRAFNRDVLLAVTGGKLRLVEPEEMPPADMVSGEPRLTLPLREPTDATELRRTLSKIGREMGMNDDRLADLTTGTTEAATNAIKHGHGGRRGFGSARTRCSCWCRTGARGSRRTTWRGRRWSRGIPPRSRWAWASILCYKRPTLSRSARGRRGRR